MPKEKVKAGLFTGKLKCKAVDGAGQPIERDYIIDGGKTEDEIFDLFVDHFREGTHGTVPREKFEIVTA